MKMRPGIFLALAAAGTLSLRAATNQAATPPAPTRPDVTYAQPAGLNLALDAYLPEGAGPFPVCILVHGGGFKSGNKRSSIYPLFAPLRDAGFACFSIDYRLAPANRWPAGMEDVEAAVRWVKAHAADFHADARRIALVGDSSGGHYVSYVGALGREPVNAVVAIYAPHDLELQVKLRGELGSAMTALLGLTEINAAAWETLRQASPINHLRAGMPPYLLIQGDLDRTVVYEQAFRFQKRSRALGNTCDLTTITNGDHGLEGWDKARLEYKLELINWLKKTLCMPL